MKQGRKENSLRAFILMPFDKEFDKIFDDLIKPALEEVGYDVKRADSIISQQHILKDIVRGIAEANLVVADLTSLNANVFYELGISHAIDRPTILITQSIDDIPFDLKQYRVIPYSVHFQEAHVLSEKLKEIGESAKSGKFEFGNPVSDFLPQIRSEPPSANEAKKVMTEAKDEMQINKKKEEEKGIWDYAVNGEKSLKDITECINRMTEATEEIANNMRQRANEVQDIIQSGVPGTAVQVHKIASMTASDIIAYAERLEHEQPKLHTAWELFAENTTGLLQTTHIRNVKDKEEAFDFRSKVNDLRSVTRLATDGLKSYREVLKNFRGISRDVNRATRRTEHVLDLLISDMEGADSYCTKVITLLDEKIAKEG